MPILVEASRREVYGTAVESPPHIPPSDRAEERSSLSVLVCRRTHQLRALTCRSC